jgi:hypothetical protein
MRKARDDGDGRDGVWNSGCDAENIVTIDTTVTASRLSPFPNGEHSAFAPQGATRF